jgi:16S rRNA (guanine966-N2)-methyltransferase
VRVVAGSARGRRLVSPAGLDTRPTSDRVRQATFNALGSLGVVEGATVLDAFAGSGALGVESLSRGADHATFVERDRRALEAVRANLASTGLSERATVVVGDALALAQAPPPSGLPAVDLALLDPPYAFTEWAALLGALDADVVVIEANRAVDPGAKWLAVRVKRYRSTVVTIARRRPGRPQE